jgi:hypothetical protein
VAGLAYEPSPESVDHRIIGGSSSSRRRHPPHPRHHHHPPPPTTHRKLRFATELTFSSTPATTARHPAARRGGDDGDDGDALLPAAPFHVGGLSTVKGEKRALFTSRNDDEDYDIDDEEEEDDYRKKSPKKEDTRKEETTQTTIKYDADRPGVARDRTTTTTMMAAATPGFVEEGTMMDETEHVGKILELLCGLGAAYKCLCQVSV